MRPPLRLALLLLVAGFALAAPGRVFWLFGRSGAGSLGGEGGAYRRAYTATLRLNQGRGEMGVWGVDKPVAAVLADLRTRMEQAGGRSVFAGGAELAWGLAVENGRVHRYLISAGQGTYCHVFQLSQSFSEYRASLQPPAGNPLPLAPAYPGSQTTSFLANEKSGLALASAAANAAPPDVRQFYATALAAAGWQRMPAGGGDAALFLKGADCLLLGVKTAGREGGTLITVTHKRLQPAEQNRL